MRHFVSVSRLTGTKPKFKDPAPVQLVPRSVSCHGQLGWAGWILHVSWLSNRCRRRKWRGARRRIEIASACMKSLTKNIIMAIINITHRENTTVQYLCITSPWYDVRYCLYGSEMWDMTVQSSKRLDADQWCLRHILRVHFTAHVSNHEIRRRSAQPPVTQTIKTRRLKLFGYLVRSDPGDDHARALNAGVDDVPQEWRRPRGRLRQTWTLRTIEQDVRQQNLGLWSARHRAHDRVLWREIVETATPQLEHATYDDDDI